MISTVGTVGVMNAYSNTMNENKGLKNSVATAPKQGGGTKVEQLKEAIGSGGYKVDISALANKMADELLMK